MAGPYDSFRTFFLRLTRLTRNDQVVLSILAVVIGAVTAVGAIGFRELIHFFHRLFFQAGPNSLGDVAAGLPWWQVLLVPTLGGLAIGLFVRYVLPGGRPLAVAQVIEAAAYHGGRMPFLAGLGAAFTSAASIGVGASVGREGPVVHLGATLASYTVERLHLSRSLLLTLLACGVASAVAASFNTPIAGVFFALEVILGHYALRAFAPIVIASVTGTIISRIHFGDFPAFIVPDYMIVSFLEFPAFAILGMLSALTALLFVHSIFFVEERWRRVAFPAWARPAVGGLAVGGIALFLPQVMGVGYEATNAALNESLDLTLLLALLVAKTAATALSLGSGFGGGVFSPSIFVGAMLGGAFGIIAASIFPEYGSAHGTYTIVGMSAVAAAVLGAPISTILIVFELTGSYEVTIAVMVATVISSLIAREAGMKSFFFRQLEREGLKLDTGRLEGLLRGISIRQVMRTDYPVVNAVASVAEIREKLRAAPDGEVYVAGSSGRFLGAIALTDLGESAFDPSIDALLNAVDLLHRHPMVLEAGDDLEKAIKLLESADARSLPVVENAETMRLIGVLYEPDAIRAYNQALLHARAVEHGER
ncbi:MAG: chloride channel protein [Alphaproteobacteria bacterium]|nr:chloride channel protein [Alphaproteobacteria bacterium]